jgi:hypothetical protein
MFDNTTHVAPSSVVKPDDALGDETPTVGPGVGVEGYAAPDDALAADL